MATPGTWRARRLSSRPAGVSSARRQHHHHLAAFELGFLLDLGELGEVVAHAVQEFGAELLMRHFAAAEPQRALDLVAFFEDPPPRAHFPVVIVIVDHRAEFYFLDLDGLLLLARFRGLLLFLI